MRSQKLHLSLPYVSRTHQLAKDLELYALLWKKARQDVPGLNYEVLNTSLYGTCHRMSRFAPAVGTNSPESEGADLLPLPETAVLPVGGRLASCSVFVGSVNYTGHFIES